MTRDWNFNVLAAYSLGKIKNGLVPCNDINNDGIPDASTTQARVGANNVATCRVTQRSSFQSPFSATVVSEYHHPVTSHVDGFARGLFNFLGNSEGDPTFAYDQVKSYGLLNLFLGIRDRADIWEVSRYGKNLSDTTKVSSVGLPATTSYQQLNLTGFGAAGPILTPVSATATSAYSVIGTTPLREFGLNVRTSFGSR